MPPHYTRRHLLRTGTILGVTGLAGCNDSSNADSGDTQDQASAITVTPPTGTVTPGSPQFYRELGEALIELRRPWTQDATTVTSDMVTRLRQEAADLLLPDITDVFPNPVPGPVDTLQDLVEATVTAFSVLHQQQRNFDRELVRAEWKAIPGDELRPLYTDLGVDYSDTVSSGQPYRPLFTVLINDLSAVVDNPSQETRETLRTHAARVHRVLSVFVLPRLDFQSPEAASLAHTLELLDATAQAIHASTTPAETATQTETDTATETAGSSQRGWPMVQYDAANTGHAPSAAGPSASITEQWRYETESNVHGSPVVAGGTVYVGDRDGVVHAISAADGAEQWRYETRSVIKTGIAVVDDTVYVTDSSTVYAISAQDGSEQWQRLVNNGASAPAVNDGNIYVTTGTGTIYALAAADGAVQWRHPTLKDTYNLWSWIAVGEDAVYVNHDNGQVYAVSKADGTERWQYETESDISAAPTVANGTVYITDISGITALSADDGTEQWRYSDTSNRVEASPAVTDDTLYTGDFDGTVHAVAADTGDARWTVQSGDGFDEGAPVVADGTIYIGDASGNVIALATSDGSNKWSHQVPRAVISAPAVVDGTVYVGGGRGEYVSALTGGT